MKTIVQEETAHINDLVQDIIEAIKRRDDKSFERLYPQLFYQLEMLRGKLGYSWDAGKLTKWKA